MKILYVCDFPIDLVGGAQKSMFTMAKAMERRGHEVLMTTEKLLGNSLDFGNIQLIEFNKPHNKYIQILVKAFVLKKSVRKYKPDIIHIQFAQYSYVYLIMRKAHLIDKKIRTIYTDRHYFDAYNERYQKMYKDCSKYWTDIICTTENNYKCWTSNLKDAENKPRIHVVPNVLEPEWFTYNSTEARRYREQYKIPEDAILIGFVGRYVDWKRWDTVKEICLNLSTKKQYYFVMAIGDEGTSESKLAIEQYIIELENILQNKLIFHLNADKNQMMDIYSAMDCFVLTSEFESFGRTLIEAMAKQTAVFATNSGGAPNVIGRDENLFEVGDYLQACKMISQCENMSFLNKEKSIAYTRAKQFYSEDVMTHKMQEIYTL